MADNSPDSCPEQCLCSPGPGFGQLCFGHQAYPGIDSVPPPPCTLHQSSTMRAEQSQSRILPAPVRTLLRTSPDTNGSEWCLLSPDGSWIHEDGGEACEEGIRGLVRSGRGHFEQITST
jgi:hypothetical protein